MKKDLKDLNKEIELTKKLLEDAKLNLQISEKYMELREDFDAIVRKSEKLPSTVTCKIPLSIEFHVTTIMDEFYDNWDELIEMMFENVSPNPKADHYKTIYSFKVKAEVLGNKLNLAQKNLITRWLNSDFECIQDDQEAISTYFNFDSPPQFNYSELISLVKSFFAPDQKSKERK